MVVELRELMRESTSNPPHDHGDVGALLQAGRRRVRVRRVRVLGGTAIAASVAALSLTVSGALPPDRTADRPEGPVLRLSDATPGVEGEDFRVLGTYVDTDVRDAAGSHVAGVTEDGKLLLQKGLTERRFTLVEPGTGTEDRLPEPPGPADGQSWMLAHLGADRLVLLTSDVEPASDGSMLDTRALVLDRATRTWTETTWEDLPPVYRPEYIHAVHDDRLYVAVRREGEPGAATPLHLWSASLSDGSDVRDEGVEVGAADAADVGAVDEAEIGAVAFTEDHMVWTDPSPGEPQRVHVRDLGGGEETSFAVPSADGCDLLALSAGGDRIVLSQRCGAHDFSSASDDRVQVLSTDGDPVATIQDAAIAGGVTGGPDGPGLVEVTSFAEGAEQGTYVYDLGSERFLRLSNSVAPRAMGGASGTPPRQFMWHTPLQDGGVTTWLGELID